MYGECQKTPELPGCKEGAEWKKSILDVIPQNEAFDSQRDLASRELELRYHCGPYVCGEGKYKPPDYQDLVNIGICDFQLDICASDVQVGQSVNSKYFRDCSLNEVKLTDLDAVYGLDPTVMSGEGIRTSENAAYIAARNKLLQLKLRRESRGEEEVYIAKKELEEEKQLKIDDELYEEQQKSRRIKLVGILAVVALIILIVILNIR
jgi:hypothetical protein